MRRSLAGSGAFCRPAQTNRQVAPALATFANNAATTSCLHHDRSDLELLCALHRTGFAAAARHRWAIAYLISILAHGISSVRVQGVGVPRRCRWWWRLGILLGIGFIINLITVNIASVIKEAPGYQENIEALIHKGYAAGVEEVPNFRRSSIRWIWEGCCRTLGERCARW